MAWIRRVALEPEQWLASLIDGYAPSADQLLEAANEYDDAHADEEPSVVPARLADIVSRWHNQKGPARYPLFEVLFDAVRSDRRRAYSKGFEVFPNPCALCHALVLRPADATDEHRSPPTSEWLTTTAYELEADDNARSYRQIIVVEPGCGRLEHCIGGGLEELRFRVKEPTDYRDYPAFEDAARNLLEEMLEVYQFPSNVVEGRLHAAGVRGVTYC